MLQSRSDNLYIGTNIQANENTFSRNESRTRQLHLIRALYFTYHCVSLLNFSSLLFVFIYIERSECGFFASILCSIAWVPLG